MDVALSQCVGMSGSEDAANAIPQEKANTSPDEKTQAAQTYDYAPRDPLSLAATVYHPSPTSIRSTAN